MNGNEGGIIAPAPGEILRECQTCDATPPVALSLCAGCRAVYYCSRDHQVEDRNAHKSICNTIKNARAKVEEEKAKLIASSGPNILEPGPDNPNYGKLLRAEGEKYRGYMYALDRYAAAMAEANTQQALVDALVVYRAMMRLDRRGDDAEVISPHKCIPPILIRLDRDQEAYDFCAWWQSNRNNRNDWENDTTVPILDLHDADPFGAAKPLDAVKEWCEHEDAIELNIENAACVALIFMRIYFAFVRAINLKSKNPKLTPDEIIENVGQTHPIDIFRKHPEWIHAKSEDLMTSCLMSCCMLANNIGAYNARYWQLLEGRSSLRPRAENPRIFMAYSDEEADEAFRRTHKAWETTPEALPTMMDWATRSGFRGS